ncbi:MAG: hypothetical protein R2695_02185 [Acidimicrobiales bacterium]
MITRYGIWVNDMVHGDFGNSLAYGIDVTELVKQRLPKTIKLIVYAQLIAFGIAIPWGWRRLGGPTGPSTGSAPSGRSGSSASPTSRSGS